MVGRRLCEGPLVRLKDAVSTSVQAHVNAANKPRERWKTVGGLQLVSSARLDPGWGPQLEPTAGCISVNCAGVVLLMQALSATADRSGECCSCIRSSRMHVCCGCCEQHAIMHQPALHQLHLLISSSFSAPQCSPGNRPVQACIPRAGGLIRARLSPCHAAHQQWFGTAWCHHRLHNT